MRPRQPLPWALESKLQRAVVERVARRAVREHSSMSAAAERELAELVADVQLPEAAE